MRKLPNKEKELPISEKVKKMFRYSPSYQAQKCYSKLTLKGSNASTRNNETQIKKSNEINCEYSSVKEKNFETNSCNDTSSWIAKLVNGIQDEDEENKIIHRLSQIENKSINDLPEDSQDYDGYNEFFLEKADELFTQKDKEFHENQVTLFEKQTPITKPMKKSIKQAMIEIEMKENLDGLMVPPVTRDSSYTKRENMSNANQRKENEIKLTKITPRKSETRKSLSSMKSRTSLLTQKPKSEVKNKPKITNKSNEKTCDERKTKNLSPQQTKKEKTNRLEKGDSTVEYGANRKSMISTGTKKQSIHRIRYETEEYPTRKNSFIEGTDFEDREDLNIVEEHSKHLNMKKLFETEKTHETKPCSSENLTEEIPISGQKRIGSIKKNKTKIENKENIENYHLQNDSIDFKAESKENLLNEQLSSIQLESNRNINNFTLNKRNFEENVLVELSSNRIRSNRLNVLENEDKHKFLALNEQFNCSNRKKEVLRPLNQFEDKKETYIKKISEYQIKHIFDKIRLNQSNNILSKNNLKLRGLTEDEKTELGSIITKIHYQSAEYDFEAFSNEYVKINYECSLKGCLSQEKLKRHSIIEPEKKISENETKKNIQNVENNPYIEENSSSYFAENEEICQISSEFIAGIGHRRRTSNIVKKKLFDEINRTEGIEKFSSNRLEKMLIVEDQSETKNNTGTERVNNENLSIENDEIISKDPYIEGPSLVEIQITKRNQPSHRTSASSENGVEYNKINLEFLKNLENTEDENGLCLIERLNRKLTTYIDKNQILNTYRQFNLNFSELKKHIR